MDSNENIKYSLFQPDLHASSHVLCVAVYLKAFSRDCSTLTNDTHDFKPCDCVTYSQHGRKEYAFDGAAGHHVRGMPLLSPLGVINSFPPSPFSLNVSRAKTEECNLRPAIDTLLS